ncbi:MAG: DUF983 domain-containing protein [Chloroflexota bacterium]
MYPTLFVRGLTRRCPRCGEWNIFRGYFAHRPECPRCGLDLEPEDGYYVGAMTVNILCAEIMTVLILVIAIVLTWPDLPVLPLIAIGIGANLLFPVLFYPLSKTIWIAIDLAFFRKIRRDELR